MPTTFRTFLRGLIGTALTWGLAWSAFNTTLVIARDLVVPPGGVSRATLAYLTLRYSTPTTFLWGCILGVVFSLFLAGVSRRWPTAAALGRTRLIAVGAAAGFAVPSLVIGFSSWLNVVGVAVCAVTGAGIGAALSYVARARESAALRSSDPSRLPSV